jgi:tetratricopeptide (TPR) repeat protein
MSLRFFSYACGTTAAMALMCSAAAADNADDLIKLGDCCAAKYQATEALQCYLPAEKQDPSNAKLLVRIAREYRHMMSDAKTTAEKLRLGGIALDYALRAAALAPNDSEAQLAPAIAYGRMLPYQGSKQQYEATRRIKAAADKAVKLDPDNDLAWHVLGRWHERLAGVGTAKRAMAALMYGLLPTTTNEEAVKCFKQAIKLNPNRPMHYLELGCTYVQMDRPSEARACLETGLAKADTEKDDPELKQHGRELLAKLH